MTGQTAPAPEPAPGDPQTPGQPAGSVTTAIPPQCPTRTRLYRGGVLLDEGFPAEQLSERLAADEGAVAWLDLYEPTEADLQIVTEEFGLHPLAVEDAISPHQRPKVDRYRTHLSATMYSRSMLPMSPAGARAACSEHPGLAVLGLGGVRFCRLAAPRFGSPVFGLAFALPGRGSGTRGRCGL